MVLTNGGVEVDDDTIENEPTMGDDKKFNGYAVKFAEKVSSKARADGLKTTPHGYQFALIYFNKYIRLSNAGFIPTDSQIDNRVINFYNRYNTIIGDPSEMPEAIFQQLGGKRRSKHSRKTRRVRKSKRKGARKSRKH
jgi:hypothetical protein